MIFNKLYPDHRAHLELATSALSKAHYRHQGPNHLTFPPSKEEQWDKNQRGSGAKCSASWKAEPSVPGKLQKSQVTFCHLVESWIGKILFPWSQP